MLKEFALDIRLHNKKITFHSDVIEGYIHLQRQIVIPYISHLTHGARVRHGGFIIYRLKEMCIFRYRYDTRVMLRFAGVFMGLDTICDRDLT
jgi:hypothetical protein